MAGSRITAVEVRRANLRIPFPAGFGDRLIGREVTALTRRAKYLLAALSSGETLLVHLGMSGDFRVERGAASDQGKHDHVMFVMSSGTTITFNDPRRFGLMDLVPAGALDEHPVIGGLGPEPLSAEFDAADPGSRLPPQEGRDQGRPARPAGGGRARQYLRERSAACRPPVA